MNIFHLKKSNEGQGLVEFALILPLLLLLIFGIVQFGIILNGYVSVTHAVREGVRLAAVGKVVEDVENKVLEQANAGFLTLVKADISVGYEDINNPYGKPVTVSATGSIDIVVPLLDIIIPNPFPVSSSATMRFEALQVGEAPGIPISEPVPDPPEEIIDPENPPTITAATITTEGTGIGWDLVISLNIENAHKTQYLAVITDGLITTELKLKSGIEFTNEDNKVEGFDDFSEQNVVYKIIINNVKGEVHFERQGNGVKNVTVVHEG